jgi:type IV pilus assembly protein PilM
MFGKKLTFGLDLGTHSVKLAAVEDGARIRGLWSSELLPARTERKARAGVDVLRARLSDLLRVLSRDIGQAPRVVTAAVGGDDIVCRYLELPELRGRELDTAVQSMMRKHVPFCLDNTVMNYLQVPTLRLADKKRGVFAVAARAAGIRAMATVLAECGLEARRMDVTPLAMLREFRSNRGSSGDEFVGLLSVGFETTQFVVLRAGFPYYARHFNTAGATFIHGQQMGRQSSWRQAEIDTRDANLALQPTSAVEPALSQWLTEMRRTLTHFERLVETPFPLRCIYLSGGTARQPGLAERLESEVGIPVLRDGWQKLGANAPADDGPNFKLAVGLALEG